MKKFIVIYTASKEACEEMMKSTPEEHKEGMGKWMEWAKKCGSGLVDMGSPLGNEQKLGQSKGAAGDSVIMGYSILQAEDMGGAKKLLKDHPHLGWNKGCDIEVHECMPMPGK